MTDSSPLLCKFEEKAQLEANNGVAQLDYISYLVNELRAVEVRESHVRDFHGLAVRDIYPCGGAYRNAWRKVYISGSDHEIPHHALVPSLMSELVESLNVQKEAGEPALARAAFALWRFNWIHPFAGGNGRTARALTYLIVCMDLGLVPPGLPQMPTLIYERRHDYVAALRSADRSLRETGEADLTLMRDLVEDVITRQLASAIDRLGGKLTAPT